MRLRHTCGPESARARAPSSRSPGCAYLEATGRVTAYCEMSVSVPTSLNRLLTFEDDACGTDQN